MGNARRAIDYHEQALAIDREMGDRRGESKALSGLGRAYFQLAHAPWAGHYYYDQAVSNQTGTGRSPRRGYRLGNLGAIYIAMGETRRAHGYLEQALAIRERSAMEMVLRQRVSIWPCSTFGKVTQPSPAPGPRSRLRCESTGPGYPCLIRLNSWWGSWKDRVASPACSLGRALWAPGAVYSTSRPEVLSCRSIASDRRGVATLLAILAWILRVAGDTVHGENQTER